VRFRDAGAFSGHRPRCWSPPRTPSLRNSAVATIEGFRSEDSCARFQARRGARHCPRGGVFSPLVPIAASSAAAALVRHLPQNATRRIDRLALRLRMAKNHFRGKQDRAPVQPGEGTAAMKHRFERASGRSFVAAAAAIGRAIALACAEAGGRRCRSCARGPPRPWRRPAREIAAYGHNYRPCPPHADLADKDQIEPLTSRKAAEALGGIDIPGQPTPPGFGSTDDESGWEKSINVDPLQATVRATPRGGRPFPWSNRANGRDPSTSSSTGRFHPSVRTTPYSVVKAAVVQYTRKPAPRALASEADPGSIASRPAR